MAYAYLYLSETGALSVLPPFLLNILDLLKNLANTQSASSEQGWVSSEQCYVSCLQGIWSSTSGLAFLLGVFLRHMPSQLCIPFLIIVQD